MYKPTVKPCVMYNILDVIGPLKVLGCTYTVEQKDCIANNIDFGQTKGKIDQTNT